MQKLGLIIPAHNEERRIGATLKEYSHFLEKNKSQGLYYEILVVINNTKDRTEEIVKYYSYKNRKIKSLNLIRGGKGFAVREGFKYFLERKFDIIGFVDADMATPPESYWDLVNKIRGVDTVIADRHDRQSKIFPKNNFRMILTSKVFNFLVRSLFLFNIKDTQCGAKLFTNKALSLIIGDLGMTEWAFDVEVLYKIRRRGLIIKSVPTVWFNRDYSKIKLAKSSLQMVFAILQLRIINSPLNKVLRPVKPIISVLWSFTK